MPINDDYSADDSNPGQLAPGMTVTGQIQFSGDSDRFHFTASAGNIYHFSLDADGANGPYNSSMLITDHFGKNVNMPALNVVDGKLVGSFMPTVTGTYSLNVGYIYLTENYSLTETVEADDFGGTRATASPLDIGATQSGVIQVPDDVDVFKVTFVAGTTYQLDVTSTSGGPYNHMQLELDGPDGKPIDTSAYYGRTSYSYTPAVTGIYTLAVSNNAQTPSTYTVSAALAPDDVGATAATAARLELGVQQSATLDPGGGDRDWFAVPLEAGKTYWINEQGVYDANQPSATGAANIRVLNAQGTALTTFSTPYLAGNNTFSFKAPATGTYYLDVGGQGAASGPYQIKTQLGVADDFGNDNTHATVLVPDAAVAGALEVPTDKDVFKLSVVAGNTYGLNLLSTSSDAGWSNDVALTAVDANGAAVALRTNVNYPTTTGLQLFTATTTGDVYVTVYSVNTMDTRSGGYELSAISYGLDDYPASNQTTAVLAPGGQLQGKINFRDDHDYVKVHLEAGRSYAFDLEGTLGGGGTLDTSSYGSGINLIDGYGSTIASSRAAYGDEGRLNFVARTTGDYYLDIHGDGKQTGTYTAAMVMTSGDLRGPQLASSTVADGATGVAMHPHFVLTFDEIIAKGDISGIQLQDAAGNIVKNPGLSQVAGAAGHQLTLEPYINFQPGASYTLTIPAASVLDLAGNQAAPVTLHFTTAPAAASGSAGNDVLLGSGTGLKLDAGAGHDTVYYSQPESNYQFQRNADGTLSVQLKGAATGDLLTGVERLAFSDGALSFDSSGQDAQVYRLYLAAFHRYPDPQGLGYWMSTMDHGVSLHDVASSYIQSAEFSSLYGANPSDMQFINLLYSNVLHRAPDADGSAYWQAALQHGGSRADLLINFSESTENQAAVIGSIKNGFLFTPFG